MKSMTGFGAASVTAEAIAIRVEMRALNHRSLDVRVRADGPFVRFSSEVEMRIRKRAERGRIDVLVGSSGPGLTPVLDRGRARVVLAEIAGLAREVGRFEDVPLALLGAVPDLFVTHWPLDAADAAAKATDAALDALDADRAREGAALRDVFLAQIDRVTELTRTISDGHQSAIDGLRTRVRDRLVSGAAPPDASFVNAEVARAAERADCHEELARLTEHTRHARSLLASNGHIGRALDFTLQEMFREASTTAMKAATGELARTCVDLRVEIDRMREQAQNVL